MVAILAVFRPLLGLDAPSKFSISLIFLLCRDGIFVHVKVREKKEKEIS